MTPDRERDLERICQAALDRPIAERDAFVAEACGGNEALRRDVEALLAQAGAASAFLETPALAAAAHAMTAGPALAVGQQVGPYTILSALGSGGMGEVYRARDARLGREVALKVLPSLFTSDPERLARFEREARVLASLNHPNIATIHGVEHVGDLHALVLEVVEGQTLAERLRSGGLPLSDTLTIARQIGEALDAAHEKGVIHRDLKPANVKIRPDGVVKLLDFGLAKAAARDASAADASQAATQSVGPTREGMILGTAAYMSPEQARGQAVDKRTDIWAFGCVLYEMLAGRAAFAAASTTETLSEVLKTEPDWQRLPVDTPDSVRRLLRRCLAKDRTRRLTDIHDARLDLDDVPSDVPVDPRRAGHSPTAEPFAAATPPTVGAERRRGALVSATAVLAGAVVATALTWVATRPPPPVPPRVSRLTITPTRAGALTISGNDRDVAIAPDGSRVVYVGNNGTQLFVRALDALEPLAVFTGAPRGPFVSPDGRWIGFADSRVLKRVPMTGGTAVTLATIDGPGTRGATWGPDDNIIFAGNGVEIGLQQVASAGGPATVLTRPDRAQGEFDHLWPERLPGGRAVLFTIAALTGGLDAAQVAVLDLQTLTRTVLVQGGSHAHYVPSGLGSPRRADREGGYLVYMASGALWAVGFDVSSLETRGTPVLVVPDVVTTTFGAVNAMVAGDGTLAYVSGIGAVGPRRTLVWVDREGRATLVPEPPRAYVNPRLSPDGTRIAVHVQDQERDLWVLDLRRTTFTRATFDPTADNLPIWTPDGARMIFGSAPTGAQNIFWQAADRTGAVEPLTKSANHQAPTDVSPDGDWLIFTETSQKTGEDVMRMTLPSTRSRRRPFESSGATPLVHSPSAERNGAVSPDGRWLAYEANDSGAYEIYVRPFPDVNSGLWQVSPAGGTQPLWAPSGQELFYVSRTGALIRVGVERGPTWATSTPTLVVKAGYMTRPGGTSNAGLSYDIAPNGQRFLMVTDGDGSDQSAAPPSIVVVQHWVEELKRLVP